jgi:hypothetical protein
VAASAGSVSALGLYQEPAPWYDPTFADTTLAFGTGASATTGTSRAALFHLGLAPIQRRSFRFAVTWSYVFLRSTETPAWGVGDPKVFVEAPLLRRAAVRLSLEGAARLPASKASLFPYAFGGQELELLGILAVPALGLHLGGGRVFTEPPGDSSLTSADVPHATHAWVLLTGKAAGWTGQLRADALVFELEGHARWLYEARVLRGDPHRFVTRVAAKAEAGPDRIFDAAVEIGFVTALR